MIYLDNAATSRYKPLSVKKAILKELNNSANPGRSSHRASMAAAERIEEAREIISACFFDGTPIFTKNCTEALNLAVFGSDLKNRVITTIYEHNSLLRPLKKLADSGKIKLIILSPDGDGFENPLKNALKFPTSMVAFSAVSNVTGYRFDVTKLANIVKENGNAKVLVDMAQGAGHVNIDYKNVDLCAFPGHKGLHGPQGTGFLLVKKDVTLRAHTLGGTGTSTLDLVHPDVIPDGMEAGTLNSPGIAGLAAGIRWTYENFIKINDKINKLTEKLYDGLREIPNLKIYGRGCGILLCGFRDLSPDGVADILNSDYCVCVRSGLHCAPLAHKFLGTLPDGAIRFSVGCDNTVSEIERTVEYMEEISRKR